MVVLVFVPEADVAVVPVVVVAVVAVIAVPDVSVLVPEGIAEVDDMLVPVVSVDDIVPVVPVAEVSVVDIVELVLLMPVSVAVAPVSVAFVFCSFLQAKPKSATATTVRITRYFFIIFLS